MQNKKANYFTVDRNLFDNFLWKDKPFSKGQAWIDLFGNANHADGQIPIRGVYVEIKRGQSGRSELTLSKDWGWSRGKVRRFLSLLQNRGMIELKQNNKTTITTICNYERFQLSKNDDGTPNSTADGTPNGHQTDTKQDTNNNNKKKDKKKTTILKPENVTDQTWSDFLTHRKSLKAPITQTAMNTFSKQAELAGMSLEDALIESISRGWRGFKAEWVKNNPQNSFKKKESRTLSEIMEERRQQSKPDFDIEIQAEV